MRMKEGGEAPVSDSVRVVQGAVEGSNVNVVESMVGMIEVQRQFEIADEAAADGREQRAACQPDPVDFAVDAGMGMMMSVGHGRAPVRRATRDRSMKDMD